MTLPLDLPAWVPWWVQLVILVLAVLVVGAYLLMPFSVFGVKARLDALDQRLDDIQSDLRELAHRADPEMRRPATWRRAEPDEDGYVARAPRAPVATERDLRPDPPPRPPIPPAPVVPERDRPVAAPPRGTRSEPTLRWPSEP